MVLLPLSLKSWKPDLDPPLASCFEKVSGRVSSSVLKKFFAAAAACVSGASFGRHRSLVLHP